MLDDLKMIHDRDAQDALGVAEKQWQQLSHQFDVQLPQFEGIQNVVFAGMGGSGWPALYLKVWPGTSVPLEVVSNYTLPRYVNEKTLVIASSYSGNTEETLSALEDAGAKGAQRIVITSGGQLAQAAKDQSLTLFTIPGGIQPRMSSFYFFAALMQIFEPLGIVPEGSTKELVETGDWLKDQLAAWRPDVPTKDNPAKQLARELMGKSVVIYSGPKLFPAANKMKICCNENAKNVAWVNYYPEFNHNEFIGWSSHPVEKPYAVVEFRSNLEHERVQKRFVVTERLLSGKRPAPEVVVPQGETLLQQLLWASNFGDFTTLYLALLNGLNPTPVDLVERFKAELDK
jgi:glucose/mannose-6-phosphate isomerase